MVSPLSLRTIIAESSPKEYCHSPCKVGIVVLGLLLIGIATFMYYSHVNATATYSTFSSGGALTLAGALVILIDALRGAGMVTVKSSKNKIIQ